MNFVAAIAAGVLSGVFARSAWLKLREPILARSMMTNFGFPGYLADTVALAEGFTALGLLAERRTTWSATVAFSLLVIFTVVLAVKIAKGENAPCPCFGATRQAVDSTAVARNLALGGLALLAATPRGDAQFEAVGVAAVVFAVMCLRQR